VSLSAIPRKLRAEVFTRDSGRCRYCGLSQIGQASVFHINHVIPRSRGGITDLTNLVLQCPFCSLHKSNKISAIDPVSSKDESLFHPLLHAWSDHFLLKEDGTITGLTPTGRATVGALCMNDPLPRLAPSIQLRLRIVPLN
jgi:5-methylcytosine-specific restriction endonuclease McrA